MARPGDVRVEEVAAAVTGGLALLKDEPETREDPGQVRRGRMSAGSGGQRERAAGGGAARDRA
ncbi:MAG: hypothetical protein ACRDPY_27480, partial [Streptosporangiaceae bacterium]